MPLRRGALLLVLLLLLPGRAHAQRILGEVLDDATGGPVTGATVSLLHVRRDTVLAAATVQDGRFAVFAPQPGEYRVRVRGYGYRSFVTQPLEIGLDQVLTLVIRLNPEAIALAPIAVVAERSEPAFMRDVHRRKLAGFGRFMLREDIEQYHGGHLAEVLRTVAGVQVHEVFDDRTGRGVPVIFTRASRVTTNPCPASLYLNGMPYFLSKDAAALQDPETRLVLFDFSEIPLADLEAIEVYRGAAELPALFSGSNSECGVVAIWLRGSS